MLYDYDYKTNSERNLLLCDYFLALCEVFSVVLGFVYFFAHPNLFRLPSIPFCMLVPGSFYSSSLDGRLVRISLIMNTIVMDELLT